MRSIASILFLLACLIMPAHAGQDVVLRYSLIGRAQDTLAALVLRFNDEQKGAARVLLQNLRGMDENELRHLPQMALLDTDDSMEFFLTRPRFKPLYKVMKESGVPFDAKRFFPLISEAVDDDDHRLQALPLGLSLPVLMWNKEAFRKAGLDPDLPPKTWHDVQDRAASLYDSGALCPLTSSRFSWVNLENVSAQHGQPVVVHEKNGFTRVVLNRLVDIKHIALLESWQKSFYFHYFGPGTEANQKFLSGECAMITGESSLYADIARGGFAVGMAELPYYDDMFEATPARQLPDGEALWVLDGHNKDEDKVIARFVSFLLRPDVQLEWLHGTAFLPMTSAVFEQLKASGVEPKLLEIVRRRLSSTTAGMARAKHGAGLNRLHDILSEEIATVWANAKPAKEALDSAMRRANAEVSVAENNAPSEVQPPVAVTGEP
jgi:sn-glycerol 3-phosphate transport system substrate-binding protein